MNKKLITSIIAGAVIAGGVVVGLQKPELLTYEEAQMLITIYNYELAKNPVFREFRDVSEKNLIGKLNEVLLKDTNKGAVIGGVNLTKDEYNNLKRVLILKSEQKRNFEKLLE